MFDVIFQELKDKVPDDQDLQGKNFDK